MNEHVSKIYRKVSHYNVMGICNIQSVKYLLSEQVRNYNNHIYYTANIYTTNLTDISGRATYINTRVVQLTDLLNIKL